MAGFKLDLQNLTGSHKAAVFLLIMGDEIASDVFKNLQENEIRKIANAMTDIDDIPEQIRVQVIDEFLLNMEDEGRMFITGEAFAKNLIDRTMSKANATGLLKELDDKKLEAPFLWVRDVDVGTLASYMKGEHPQTVAMILSHFPPEMASEILSTLNDELKGNISLRIARLGQIPDEVIREVDNTLKEDLAEMGASGTRAGGVEALVNILSGVDRATEDFILETVEEESGEMANQIRELMFVFEDLSIVDDRGMREILKKVESSQLVLAMKTASDEMKNKIMSNLSARAAEMLQEDLEVMGPVRLAQVEEAQQEIIQAAKDLEADGTIVLGKGKEDVLV